MPGCFLAPYEAWRERHTWVLRKLPPVGIHKCKPQKLILEDLFRKGISGKDTGKLSALRGRLEKQTWLPPWERLRLVWCGPCCPPPGYQTFQLAHQTLLKLHTCCYGLLLVLLPGLPQRQNIVAFHGHHHHIRPLHCPHVFESLASHSKSNVYASDYPSLGSMHKP